MRKSLVVLLLLVSVFGLLADVMIDFNFSEPTLERSGDFINITKGDMVANGEAGAPQLPYKGTMLYLGNSVEILDVKVERIGRHEIKLDRAIYPIQAQHPLSMMDNVEFTRPNSDIYNSVKAFPVKSYRNVRTDFLAGHSLGSLAVTPYEYLPLEQKLVWFESVSITVVTGDTARATESQKMLKTTQSVYDRLVNIVDNAEDINFLPQSMRSSGIKYLIIYPESYLTQINEIAKFHEKRARRVQLLSIESIQNNPLPDSETYVDLQDKIRKYIKYYYTQENNDLEYVLLAGDDDVIPHRGMYASNSAQTDSDIPADCYYSNLDGTFDDNGDGTYGDTNGIDLVNEVAIGRMCYNNEEELNNIIHKTYMWSEEPVVDNITDVLMVGEYLWDAPTYGGDYMDELIGNHNVNGYETTGFPEGWDFEKLYDRDLGGENSWGPNALFPKLSSGPAYVNHLGHSNTTYNMRLSESNVTDANITNNGISNGYSIDYTQGCYAGAFDNRGTEVGNYMQDCITEKFCSIENSVVGMVSCSRYGWGSNGSTNGASQYFHREWVDAVFNEGILEMGKAVGDSKVDNIPNMSEGTMFWCYFENNYFGDPALMLWTSVPNQIVESIATIWQAGLSIYPLDVATENVVGCLLDSEDNIIWSGSSNSIGGFSVRPSSTLFAGTYKLMLYSGNCLPKAINITVTQGEEALIGTESIVANLENNMFCAGQEIGFNLSVKNYGSNNFTEDAYVKLQTTSEHIEVVEDSLFVGNLDGSETIDFTDAFVIRNNGGSEDNEIADLYFISHYGDSTSRTKKEISLNAANVKFVGISMDIETVSPESGSTVPFVLNLHNSGSGSTPQIDVSLSSNNAGVVVTPSYNSLRNIPGNSDYHVEDTYEMVIADSVEDGTLVELSVMITDYFYHSNNFTYSFLVGVDKFTFETGEMGFTLENPSSAGQNQWHRSSASNNTENGEYCFKFGGDGDAEYANNSYGYLLTPEFNLRENATLAFSHKMDAEADNQAWDGGFVQMSVNGAEYVNIEPTGGYPYVLHDNNASPLPSGIGLWSGTFDWTDVEISLGNSEGTVQFRFVFGSDAYVSKGGWFIDDLYIINGVSNDDVEESVPELIVSGISTNYPNPFNPETTISYSVGGARDSKEVSKVELEIYNIKGQKVKTLIDSEMSSGNYRAVWKGRNQVGSRVSSGIYFAKLKVGSTNSVKKMVLMK